MRPINLSIKGLNSFVEKQVIDFDQLTQHGLFGVFGPTGSGKSTILDGITIALYGKTSRNSNNFINTQCDQMQVVFKFSVNHITYEVVRSYRRQKDSIHASKPTRLVKDNEIVAESTKEVDAYCLEVIGLKFDDFIRTVVLPQGKFSEFIKLKGKERRNMLERLFNLERYGDEFSSSLNRRIRKLKDQDLELSGQLQGYDDVSENKIKDLEESINKQKESLLCLEKKYKKKQNDYKDMQVIFDNQNKLEKAQDRLDGLKKQDIDAFKTQIKTLEKIKPMVPLFKQMKNNERVLLELEEKLISLNTKLNQEVELKEGLQKSFTQMKESYADQLEELQKHINDLKTGLETLDDIQKKEEILKNLKSQERHLQDKLETNQSLKEEAHRSLEEMTNLIKELERNLESHQAFIDFEAVIDEGYQIEKEIDQANASLEQLKEAKKIKKAHVNEQELVLKNLLSSLESIQLSGEVLSFEAYQKKKDQYDLEKQKLEAAQENHDKRSILLEQLQENKLTFETIKSAYDDYKKGQEDQLIQAIQKNLHDGDSCPVCGSEITRLTPVEPVTLDQSAEEKYHKHVLEKETLEKSLEELSSDSFDPNHLLEVIEKIRQLDSKYQSAQENEKKKVEKEHLRSRINDLQGHIKSLKDDLQQLQDQENDLQELLNNKRTALNHLDHDFKDFLKAKEALKLHKIRMSEINKDLKAKQVQVKDVEAFIQKTLKTISEIKLEKSVVDNDIKHQENFIQEKRKDLDNRFGHFEQLASMLEENQRKESDLKNKYQKLELDLKEAEKSYQSSLLLVKQTQLLLVTKKGDQEALEETLKDYDHEAMINFDEDTLNTLKSEVELYEKEYAVLTEQVQSLTKALEGRRVSEQALEELEASVKDLEGQRDDLLKQIAVDSENKERLEKRFVAFKTLLDQKSSLETQLDLHNDLDKLFRGKKFVEFIATYQLRHVTLAASDRLYEITSGKYGLELDDSMFIVRDFKNGGAVRSMSTLSGGESFLVSLSLALALSSQIQLKGHAPLELFFLDEGFGTLDDYVLDMVMTALEKIHHQYLSIGLISHVENIKNRVPIKLNVKASSIERGSLISIERT